MARVGVRDTGRFAFMPMVKVLTLRAAGPGDRHFFYRLAEDPVARASSFSGGVPTWEDHTRWFWDFIRDNQILKWVALSTDPVGVVWVKRDNGNAVISVNVIPEVRGLGYGSQAIALAADYAHRDWGLPITAYIKEGNPGSVKAFEKAGFEAAGSTQVRGQPALIYRYEGL